MSELGVDLEILGVHTGPGELVHHAGRDGRREDLVGPRQDVEHLRAHPGEVALGVELHRGLAQGDHRVGVELTGPAFRELPEARRTLIGVGDRAREHLVLPVALERLDAELEQRGEDPATLVVPAAVPVRVGGEAIEQTLHGGVPTRALGGGHDRDGAAHERGIGHRPLERLVAAVRRPRDGDEVLDVERFQQSLLGADDVAQGDVREVGTVRLAGLGILARGRRGAERGAEHVGRHDVVAVGVERLARADEPVPPADGRVGDGVLAGGVVVAREAVGHEDRIATPGREPSVRLVGERQLGQHLAALELERGHREGPAQHALQRVRRIRGAAVAVAVNRARFSAGRQSQSEETGQPGRTCHLCLLIIERSCRPSIGRLAVAGNQRRAVCVPVVATRCRRGARSFPGRISDR